MNVVRPDDWPSNPYGDKITKLSKRKTGGLLKVFHSSFKSSLSGNSNEMLTLTLNKSIVDFRDQRILRYLKQKKSSGIDLNTLF